METQPRTRISQTAAYVMLTSPTGRWLATVKATTKYGYKVTRKSGRVVKIPVYKLDIRGLMEIIQTQQFTDDGPLYQYPL